MVFDKYDSLHFTDKLTQAQGGSQEAVELGIEPRSVLFMSLVLCSWTHGLSGLF
jgi:hypothetical protein